MPFDTTDQPAFETVAERQARVIVTFEGVPYTLAEAIVAQTALRIAHLNKDDGGRVTAFFNAIDKADRLSKGLTFVPPKPRAGMHSEAGLWDQWAREAAVAAKSGGDF